MTRTKHLNEPVERAQRAMLLQLGLLTACALCGCSAKAVPSGIAAHAAVGGSSSSAAVGPTSSNQGGAASARGTPTGGVAGAISSVGSGVMSNGTGAASNGGSGAKSSAGAGGSTAGQGGMAMMSSAGMTAAGRAGAVSAAAAGTTSGVGGASASAAGTGTSAGGAGGSTGPAAYTIELCPGQVPMPLDIVAQAPACDGAIRCGGESHCIPRDRLGSYVSERQLERMPDCRMATGKCIPDQILFARRFSFKPCVGDLGEGVCAPQCFVLMTQPLAVVLQPGDFGCGSEELCAPCLNPLDMSNTGACDINKCMDTGP